MPSNDTVTPELREELRQLRVIKKLSQTELAAQAGVSLPTIQRFEAGKPVGELVVRKLRLWMQGESVTERPLSDINHGDLVYVPLVAPRLAAGSGEVVQSEETVKYYGFRREWLSTKGSAKDLVLMKVKGSSMTPTILQDDMVMVNMARKDLEDDQIFAIGWYDELAVKRLRRTASGGVEVVADNPAHPTRLVEHEGDGLRIVGRVVWLARDFG